MAKPYSMDLREHAMARLAAGKTTREVAAALDVVVASVVKWSGRQRRIGSAAPGQMGGHRPFLICGAHRDWVLTAVEAKPHVTLAPLAEGSRRGD